jgi:hypothetical protein
MPDHDDDFDLKTRSQSNRRRRLSGAKTSAAQEQLTNAKHETPVTCTKRGP